MIQSRNEFLEKLESALPDNVNKKEILKEYSLHFDEKVFDHPDLNAREIIEKIGDPLEIASYFREVAPISKGFVQRNFVFCNGLFFMIGSLLTVCYHLFSDSIFSNAWLILAKVPLTIVLVYTLFWLFLGFEIGKEYGVRGKTIFSKTVFVSLIPNVSLMLLILFQMIPIQWFQPLLTPAFIMICVTMTFLVYPISKLGYYLGVYRSV